MIRGSCHCGSVSFELAKHRDFLTECNCSICRRYAALWLHCKRDEVQLEAADNATSTYEWGDRMLAFHSCRTCGCITHWTSTNADNPGDMALNCRLAEPQDLTGVRIRRLDGADTWRYLDT